MKSTELKKVGKYYFGTGFHFKRVQLEYLIYLFQKTDYFPAPILGGRSLVHKTHLEDIGPVVVKTYFRGGLLRHLVKKSYVKWGKPRCQREYELLQKVRSLGVRVPEPIAFAFKGGLIYKGWLVTREILEIQTLATLSILDADRAVEVMEDIISQISTLIRHRILHVDLHPGNVLVDQKNAVFFVDFDKGHEYLKDEAQLRRRYFSRWERAVKKYCLPEMLIETMRVRLLGHQ